MDQSCRTASNQCHAVSQLTMPQVHKLVTFPGVFPVLNAAEWLQFVYSSLEEYEQTSFDKRSTDFICTKHSKTSEKV